MKIKLSPKEVLVAVITYYVNKELPDDLDMEVTARFTESNDGTVEITLPDNIEKPIETDKKLLN